MCVPTAITVVRFMVLPYTLGVLRYAGTFLGQPLGVRSLHVKVKAEKKGQFQLGKE